MVITFQIWVWLTRFRKYFLLLWRLRSHQPDWKSQIAVRKTSVSRHDGGPIRGPLKPVKTIVLWWSKGFYGALNFFPHDSERRAAILIVVVILVWVTNISIDWSLIIIWYIYHMLYSIIWKLNNYLHLRNALFCICCSIGFSTYWVWETIVYPQHFIIINDRFEMSRCLENGIIVSKFG